MNARRHTRRPSRTRRARGRRAVSIALAVGLAVGTALPFFHAKPVHAVPATTSAGRTSVSVAPALSDVEARSVAARGTSPRHHGPGSRPPSVSHEEQLSAQTNDSPTGLAWSLSANALPTAATMLAAGFVTGAWVAFVQHFMSRASRTRGQPSLA